MKNHQGQNKYTNTNVLEKIIKLTVQSSFAVAMMAAPSTAGTLSFEVLDTNSTGIFDDGAALHTAYDPMTQTLFKVNNSELKLDIFDISNTGDIDNPIDIDMPIDSIDLSTPGLFGGFEVGGINDVAYSKDQNIFAVAVENVIKTDPGLVAFFNSDGVLLDDVQVGALPDFLTFTGDGSKLLVANEGEANGEYTIDPEGSVSIIDMSKGAGNLEDSDVTFAGFEAFNDQKQELIDQGVRIFGPSATEPDAVAKDLEPESIAVSGDGTKAYVALQENNAIAILNLDPESVDYEFGEYIDIVPLGFKDHSEDGNGLDASDRDDGINIRTYENLYGMYQFDEIASFKVGDDTYFVGAGEGSGRDEDGFSEEKRVQDLVEEGKIDLDVFGGDLLNDENLGRLTVTNALGDTDGDGLLDELYAFGSRSFAIFDDQGKIIFDSGDEFERKIAELFPDYFNSTDDENQSFDNRSDNKGPEPEGITTGKIGYRTFAFIGLERIGGFMTYDISNPLAPKFISYTNDNRDFSVEISLDANGDPDPTDAELAAVGDLSPEGITFISAEDSSTGKALLVLAHEVSGTTTIYEINDIPEPGTIFGLLAFGAAGKLLLKRKSQTTEEKEKA
ncbi:MAG: choice-of-anchor I family protein [Cyanobacteria bacterium P01_H01_bin.35]